MHKQDLIKLQKAGFTILRVSNFPDLNIRYLTEDHAWRIKERFENKEEREQEVQRILNFERQMIFETSINQ